MNKFHPPMHCFEYIVSRIQIGQLPEIRHCHAIESSHFKSS